MKKILPIFVALILIIGFGAFYGGMKYPQSRTPRGFSPGDFQNFRSLSSAEREQRMRQFGGNGLRGGLGGGQKGGNGLAAGEIISKDDKTVTIKLSDSGSKIIFYSEATEIGRLAKGVVSDLEVGKNIAVTGAANADGSITAQSIQLTP